jgi:hypothetical protein
MHLELRIAFRFGIDIEMGDYSNTLVQPYRVNFLKDVKIFEMKLEQLFASHN